MSNGDIHSFHFAFIVHAHREHCSPPSTFVPSKIENKRRLDKVRGEWHSNVLTKSHDFQFARTMCISHFTYCTMNMTWGIALLCNRTNRNHWRASIHDYARALFFSLSKCMKVDSYRQLRKHLRNPIPTNILERIFIDAYRFRMNHFHF